MGKISWTKEEIILLEKLYSLFLPINIISRELPEHSKGAISTKINKLGLSKKYIYPNSRNFIANYQDYDWCYEHFINQGLNHEQMAEIAGCKKRTIKKWCNEIHRISNITRSEKIKLTTQQIDLIIGSMLGDGHIDKREEYPLFIVTHAENQKDYLYYKHEIMKNLCNMQPKYYDGKDNMLIVNTYCNTQPTYRFNTRVCYCLDKYRKMDKIDFVKLLNEYSFSIWILDDGHCNNKKYWSLSCPFSEDVCLKIQNILNEKFNISSIIKLKNNYRYLFFNSENSKIISKIILKNIPNNLDIIKYKIKKEINKDVNIIT